MHHLWARSGMGFGGVAHPEHPWEEKGGTDIRSVRGGRVHGIFCLLAPKAMQVLEFLVEGCLGHAMSPERKWGHFGW